MKNKINKPEKTNIKKAQGEDLKKNESSNKYKRIITLLSNVAFCIIIIIPFLVYKKPFENRLVEKDKEIELIKRQLKEIIQEKTELHSKIQKQNSTLQNQIVLLQNQNSKYENDIVLNKNINKELEEQLKLYQNDLETKEEEFKHKSNILEKKIIDFEDIVGEYKKAIKEKEFTINTLNDRINDKEKELKEMQLELSNNNTSNTLKMGKQLKKRKTGNIDKEFSYDKIFFQKYNINAKETINNLGYSLLLRTHSIEKGLSHFNLRPFGKKKVRGIIKLLKAELKYDNHERNFNFINGINTLREYKSVYEKNKWTKMPEYKEVSEFLKYYENIEEQKTGAYILTKEELKSDYNIDYGKFIKSRHSTRNYKHLKLRIEDVQKAVEMAKYTPSACNRQFIKLHYFSNDKMKQNVLKYSIGKGGLYLEGVNTFIITFDVNALRGVGERNQGYFNAGLFATNLINSFHSLGIGTCLIQFNNSSDEEEKLKQLNNIPSNERIAVILFAGYYDDKSIFAVSPRRYVEEYLVEHK